MYPTDDESKTPTPGPRPNDLLRDLRQHFEAVVTQVLDYAIFTIDAAGKPMSWNEGVRRVLGFEALEFVNVEIDSTIFTPEALAEGVPQREREQASRTGQSNDDRWMRRKDGSRFFSAGTTTAIHDAQGELAGFIKVMRDQTQWKNAEMELHRSVAELARMDQARNAFIAVLAHELRNPLAPLGNAIQVLKRSPDDRSRVLSTLELMERQVAQMSRLIADLLDVSRIAHDKIELKRGPVEVSTLIQQALDVVRPQAEALRHHVSVAHSSRPLYVDVDATRLVQALVNLLNNAFKFTPGAGQIWLSTETEKDQVVIRIKDSGIGIPQEDQSRIFEMFSQVDSSKERSRGGLGIGLALVCKIAELHGGTVEVNSAGRGTGSEFAVRLPLIAEPAEAADRGAPDAPPTSVKRILVVDDNEDSALTLATLLELEGHHAAIANSGESAIRIADMEKPELVILDIGMPGMNGLKVAEHLRQQLHDPDPMLVALTGWDQPEDRRLTAEAGFNYHLVKPVDADALREILGALERRTTGGQPAAG
jgi:PAS domain S-box-containing protein